MSYFWIFIGGGLGSITRFLFTKIPFTKVEYLQLSTLSANFLSSFILGLAVFYWFQKPDMQTNLRLFIITGFCGGFSTFSTFSFEMFTILRTGEPKNAFIYATISLVVGLVAVFSGWTLGKQLF